MIMKKVFFFFVLSVVAIGVCAHNVVVKAGTQIPLKSVNTVKAADLDKGESVLFRVARDVNVNGVTAVPYGISVKGTVYEARRSAWWGTRGRLGITINEIVMPDGTVIPLDNGNIYIKGENRTGWSILVFAMTLLPIPCGGKAQMPMGYEVVATVASSVSIEAGL